MHACQVDSFNLQIYQLIAIKQLEPRLEHIHLWQSWLKFTLVSIKRSFPIVHTYKTGHI